MKYWRTIGVRLILSMMIVSVMGSLVSHAATAEFSDVKGHWASETIRWAVDRHIVAGYPDGTFRPNNTVSEPEFLVMLIKAYPDSIIPDLTDNKPWYKPYYSVGGQYNWPLLHETSASRFNRGSVAHLLAATQGTNLSMQDSVQYVLDHDIANGKTSATIAGFGIQDPLKRSEALTLIRNMVDSGLGLVKAKGEVIPESTVSFSVRGIAIGDSKQIVLDQLGKPARYDQSEYGFEWYIYNQDYTNYAQIGIHNNKVVGLYSNVDNWVAKSGVTLGSTSTAVTKAYGQGLTSIRKGNTIFQINRSAQEESPRYLVDGSYVNLFLDKHNKDTVSAILIIEQDMELSLQSFYGKPSEALRISFERQVFDLTNSIRIRFGKKALMWSDEIAATARKHSKDMAVQGYFDHDNMSGLSPFDRMEDDGIQFSRAAENIAMGQTSAIFAHEGWMNSEGHRRNNLLDIQRLGVGVYLGSSYEPYYTQNFYTPLQ